MTLDCTIATESNTTTISLVDATDVIDPPMAATNMGRELLESVDQGLASLRSRPWKANLPFRVFECLSSEEATLSAHLSPAMFQQLNLFNLTSEIQGFGGKIACFDPNIYPVVSGGWKANKQSWKKLSSDLIKASQDHGGSPLVSNGAHGEYKVLHCSHFRHYNGKENTKAGGKYRRHTINRDKQNARKGSGLSQRKKT